MTNNTATINNSALGHERNLSSLTFLFDSIPLRANVSVEGTRNLMFSAYNAFQSLVHISRGTNQVNGRATVEEPVDLDIQRGHNEQAGIIVWVPENMTDHELDSHGNPLITDTDDLEVARESVAEDGSSIRALNTVSKRARLWVALLIIVVLSLIVIPGLVLGIVTKKLPWGIALCGLIATVISFFASFYYHLDK